MSGLSSAIITVALARNTMRPPSSSQMLDRRNVKKKAHAWNVFVRSWLVGSITKSGWRNVTDGAQLTAMVRHPLAGEVPTELVASDHSKILDYAIGCIEVN